MGGCPSRILPRPEGERFQLGEGARGCRKRQSGSPTAPGLRNEREKGGKGQRAAEEGGKGKLRPGGRRRRSKTGRGGNQRAG